MSQRARAIKVGCPKCGAEAGARCIAKWGLRTAMHRERHTAAAAAKVRPGGSGFYQSDEWRELRYRALKLHGGACQCCGARAKTGKGLHVDHIKPRSKFPHLSLDLNNLQVLCADCNLGKRAWDDTDWRAA